MDEEFAFRVKKQQLADYRDTLKEIAETEAEIKRELKKKESLPIVRDRAKSSMAEWPYIETHVEIEAPDPLPNMRIERLVMKKRMQLNHLIEERLAVEDFIMHIRKSRTRRIFDFVYVKGKSQQAAAARFGLDQSRISRIIDAEIKRQIKIQK